MTDYTPTHKALPPDGLLVDTLSPGGLSQPLKRQGRLWLIPDGSMYVYYTPAYWRTRPEQSSREQGET